MTHTIRIVLKENQNLFFTSDSHFSHKNIVRGVTSWADANDKTRDFDTVEEMNQILVDNINSVVGEDDILIHLGDWSFGGFDQIAKFRSQLNVADIRIMLGNHDHHILRGKDGINYIFTDVWKGLKNLNIRYHDELKVESTNVVISHYPLASWQNMNDGWFHLHGHVHLPEEHKLGRGRSLDVGVDGNNLNVYDFREIRKLLSDRPIKHLRLPSDHHED